MKKYQDQFSQYHDMNLLYLVHTKIIQNHISSNGIIICAMIVVQLLNKFMNLLIIHLMIYMYSSLNHTLYSSLLRTIDLRVSRIVIQHIIFGKLSLRTLNCFVCLIQLDANQETDSPICYLAMSLSFPHSPPAILFLFNN